MSEHLRQKHAEVKTWWNEWWDEYSEFIIEHPDMIEEPWHSTQ